MLSTENARMLATSSSFGYDRETSVGDMLNANPGKCQMFFKNWTTTIAMAIR
jgi:hypothetical protein